MTNKKDSKKNDFQKIVNRLHSGSKLNHPFESKDGTYRSELEDRLNNFNGRLKKLSENDLKSSDYLSLKLPDFERTKNQILKVVDTYLSGSIGSAYDEFEKLTEITIIKDSIPLLTESLDDFKHKEYKSLYRIRTSEKYIADREDIFHIPFEHRHLVSSQRFSISGLPSLYLGSSLYACWQEMGRPDFNKVYVSRYQVDDSRGRDVKVLNLAYSLELLKKSLLEKLFDFSSDLDSDDVNNAYIALFPLVMACSFTRKHDSSMFNEEYILPNLLLQWTSRNAHEICGIKYLSSKTRHVRNHEVGFNYVFPPQSKGVMESGHCPELKSIFKLTRPVSWQLMDTLNEKSNSDSFTWSHNEDLDEQFVKSYKKTKFFNFESKLGEIPEMSID